MLIINIEYTYKKRVSLKQKGSIMRVPKLNQTGASHLIVPVILVAIITLVGVKVLTTSHADQINLTTSNSNSLTYGNNVAWQGPLNSSASSSQVSQSSVPYTLIGYQQVVLLGSGQSVSYIGLPTNGGFPNNVQTCYDVYVRQPKSGTVTATIEIANKNNVATYKLSSTTNDNLRRICVNPGTGANPGYNIKNATPINQNITIEVLDEQLRW